MSSGIELLNWDSEHWGVRTARASVTGHSDLLMVAAGAREVGAGLLYLSMPAADLSLAHAAASDPNLRMVDIRVVLSRVAQATTDTDSTLRPAEPGDLDALQSLAAVAHTNTRFFNDPRIDREKAAELYRRWILQHYERLDHEVIVAVIHERVLGYVTLGVDGPSARIGLLAVMSSILSLW